MVYEEVSLYLTSMMALIRLARSYLVAFFAHVKQ